MTHLPPFARATRSLYVSSFGYALLILLSAALMSGCAVPKPRQQQAAEQELYQSLVSAQQRAQQVWSQRLAGTWLRTDGGGDHFAAAAHTLHFDGATLQEQWLDATERSGAWALLDATHEVIHLERFDAEFEPQVWRIFLSSGDELTLFRPGHLAQNYVRSMPDGQGAAPKRGDMASTPVRDGAAASGMTAEHPAAEPSRDVLSHEETGQEDIEPWTEEELRKHGAPTLEELRRQMRSVDVAVGNSDRKLGERLLIGSWKLTEISRERLNTGVPAAQHLESVTLRFDQGGSVTMVTRFADGSSEERGVWRLEGMYGPELRVILSLVGSSARRERMLFLDIDRFVLSPQDGALGFERTQL